MRFLPLLAILGLLTGCSAEPVDIATVDDSAQPELDSAQPDLDVVQPDPDVAEPELDGTRRDPDVATPDPDVLRPDPDVAQPDPDVVPPDLDVPQPDPDVAQPDLDVTQPEPDIAPPDITQPEPDTAESDSGSVADDDVPEGVDAGSPGPVWRIYVAPDGDDAATGTSMEESVKTLKRVHQLVAAGAGSQDIEVRIAPGDYYGQSVTWTATMPDHSIKFMPLNDDKVRPVFDGCLATGECPGGTWFKLSHSAGEETNLIFWYIRVQNYGTAISLNGNRNAEENSNGSNTIYGCYLDSIGNVFNPSLSASTAVVRLVNSDDNLIRNNHFVSGINTSSAGLIHSIYVAHMSDRNQILKNRFKLQSGDAIRIRDYSNDNVIEENKFIAAGISAGYTEWYCDHDIADNKCTKVGPECPSWKNVFRYNLLDGNFECAALGTWKLFQDDQTTGCSPPSPGAKRVSTAGNEQTSTPCSTE